MLVPAELLAYRPGHPVSERESPDLEATGMMLCLEATTPRSSSPAASAITCPMLACACGCRGGWPTPGAARAPVPSARFSACGSPGRRMDPA
jgi:hypothetical protein